MDALRRAHRPASTDLFDYSAHPEAERVIVMMGSGAETVARDRRLAERPRRASRRCSRCACTGRSRSRHFLAALPPTTRAHRRARPHQGARRASASRSTRTSSPRCARRADDGTVPRAHAARDRRPLRPVVEGIHAGDGAAPSSTSSPGRAPKRHFTVGIVDDVTHLAALRPRLRHRARRRRARACSAASAPTAPSAPTRTRSRSSARRPTASRRATSSTTRRSRARSPSRTCASARGRSARRTSIRRAGFVAVHQWDFFERYDVLGRGGAGRDAAAQLRRCPTPSSGTRCRARCRRPSSSKQAEGATPSTPRRVAREAGMGTRINTIMQTCFFALAGIFPREEAIAHIKHSIEKTYGAKGRGGRAEELRRGRRVARAPARGARCPAA